MTTVMTGEPDQFAEGYEAALAGEPLNEDWPDEKKKGYEAQRADHWGDDNFG